MATNGSQNIVTAASGKVLQGAGVSVAPAFSTATYPSTASSGGTILRADGTNWVATTATFPDTAGASGNVLMSNGSGWVSSTLSSNSFVQFMSVNAFLDLPDATTYYFINGALFMDNTSATAPSAKYLCPIACTITKVYGVFEVFTPGSNEDSTLFLRVNNTTNYNVATNVKLNASTFTVNNTSLSISLSAGDIIMWGFTSATFATNPIDVGFSGSFST